MADQEISLVGPVDDHMGLVAWNADGTGPEPAVEPRAFDTPLGTITHHVYAASPDYDRIDPESTGGLRGLEILGGFGQLSAALEAAGLSIASLTVSLPVMTEAPGEFHHDPNHLETRTLVSPDHTVVKLGGKPLIALPVERWVNTIDWGVERFEDSVHRTESQPVRPIDISGSPTARRAAAAVFEDVGEHSLTVWAGDLEVRFDRSFGGHGRLDGIYVDLASGGLRVV